MSDPADAGAQPRPKEDPEALVLCGPPRPAVRFRRTLIVGITASVAAALVALSWLALEPPSFHKAAEPAGNEQPAPNASDALADAPGSYDDVPRLGPPLPGDLGKPLLDRQRALDGMPAAPGEAVPPDQARMAADAERQRLAAARLAARSSPVLVQLEAADDGGTTGDTNGAGVADPQARSPGLPDAGAAVPAMAQHKIDFVASRGDVQDGFHAGSRWTLSPGTVIAASLVTGLDSDLPGIVLAQVTEAVRDSATGRTILIPQGSRLIGRYDNVVAHGQRRALLVWTKIVLPDGSSAVLDNMPASDSSGYAGLEDKVDSHGWQVLKGVALSTLLGVGTELSLGTAESALVRALRESAQQGAAHAGDRLVGRDLDVQPTIKVRPGWPVRAIVNKDLVLQPWRG